jgi:BCD family chlorophyll transporter-like MFS transporter
VRDSVSGLAQSGALGTVLNSPVTGYSVVYHIEIYLLFVVLIALGPLLRRSRQQPLPAAPSTPPRFGLAEMPG